MPLRIGLIGAGRHGSRYIHHLLHDLPGVSLAALCRKRTGEGLPSLPTSEIPVYGDYRALIADPTVEAVVVVTHPSLCPEICFEAVKAKKPILIEKPLAPTGREARAMVTAAEEAGLLLMTAQTLRFDSTIPGSVREIRSARGALGIWGSSLGFGALSHRRRGGRRPLRVGPASERGTGHDGDRAGPDRERHAMPSGHRTRRSGEGCEN